MRQSGDAARPGGVTNQQRLDAGPVLTAERHNPAQEFEIDEVGDAVLVEAAAVAKPAPDDAPEAGDGPQVEKDHGIRALEPLVERSEPHCVHDPRVAGDQPRVRRLPARSIEVGVTHRQIERRSQSPCKRRLARAAAADDCNAEH